MLVAVNQIEKLGFERLSIQVLEVEMSDESPYQPVKLLPALHIEIRAPKFVGNIVFRNLQKCANLGYQFRAIRVVHDR